MRWCNAKVEVFYVNIYFGIDNHYQLMFNRTQMITIPNRRESP
ncbi:hypothetical protein QWZ13_19215 [Reinekea marina]|nr:hypothetical protein [Reinekea marina]MDN3651045.1 hypothetical protein [Reinekea marina]